MFALTFRFTAGRYHATPWGRNVNEGEVAWPPEPWRVLRALIATYWRKGDCTRWPKHRLARLVDQLAGTLPEYALPLGAIHAHTRHYMPQGGLEKSGEPKRSLVFDGFLRLHSGAELVVSWPNLTLDGEDFVLAADLAAALGYLGRAESWTECQALDQWDGRVNCRPRLRFGANESDPLRMLAPLAPAAYAAERQRLLDETRQRLVASSRRPIAEERLQERLDKELCGKGSEAHTLPERLVDALALDTADLQDRGWSRPPAAQEVLYGREREAAPQVVSRISSISKTKRALPTVARFLVAGRPLPRIEDAVQMGELMRLAALAKFGWASHADGFRRPLAPSEISGRDEDGRPLRDPSHRHAFWLPEDADGDGWIDHISVFVASGMSDEVQAQLDRITRLWEKSTGQPADGAGAVCEWRLALEGFGSPEDFGDSARIFGRARRWRSATPFLAAGHLKAAGYEGEIRRLLRLRGLHSLHPRVTGGRSHRALRFRRFRSHRREARPDAAGALLAIELAEPIQGPLAIGYGSHFGLGLFIPDDSDPGRSA